MQDIKEDYDQMRKDYLENQKDKVLIPLPKARTQGLKINWQSENLVQPSFLGVRHIEDYDLNQVREFISWDPFFQTWQLRGKYPN